MPVDLKHNAGAKTVQPEDKYSGKTGTATPKKRKQRVTKVAGYQFYSASGRVSGRTTFLLMAMVIIIKMAFFEYFMSYLIRVAQSFFAVPLPVVAGRVRRAQQD